MIDTAKNGNQSSKLVLPLVLLVVVLVGFMAFWFAVIEPMRERTAENRLKTREIMADIKARLDERDKLRSEDNSATVTDDNSNAELRGLPDENGDYRGRPIGERSDDADVIDAYNDPREDSVRPASSFE